MELNTEITVQGEVSNTSHDPRFYSPFCTVFLGNPPSELERQDAVSGSSSVFTGTIKAMEDALNIDDAFIVGARYRYYLLFSTLRWLSLWCLLILKKSARSIIH